ncbi:MAG: sugar transferase [Phycisphaeraceae bacterium]
MICPIHKPLNGSAGAHDDARDLRPRADAGASAPVGQPSAESIWGLEAVQLHERFWASRCVQVVRRGDGRPLARHAELYLLVDEPDLVQLRLRRAVNTLTWRRDDLLFVRLHGQHEPGYREQLIADEQGRFHAFHRQYRHRPSRMVRVAITPHRWLARRWQHAETSSAGWRRLRQTVPRDRRATLSLAGQVMSRHEPGGRRAFVQALVAQWRRPDLTIARAQPWHENVWVDAEVTRQEDARFIGPVWVGAGRRLAESVSIAGPVALWDTMRVAQGPEAVPWARLDPRGVLDAAPADLSRPPSAHRHTCRRRPGKRVFDLLFASLALLVVLPLFPLIMLAIWWEDGRPFFFVHQRETLGGREFPCLKFRSMRNDAEQIKAQLAAANQVDGPQFFMADDPRVTRVGQFLRKTHLDELPQLLNVLVGHMSVVGPRPSPHSENQYCPAWREARLSIRPGITGLWQVMRTRREGEDFQEWIRYDIDYVEHMNWQLDLWILWRTVGHVLGWQRTD